MSLEPTRGSKEPEGGFRWSFDEIRNMFVRARTSNERVSSAGSFHWSFSGTFERIRSKFSSREPSLTEKPLAQDEGMSKRARMDNEQQLGTREERRENRREMRKGKSEKERDRRNNVNGLFYTLGGLLGMEAGVKNKTQILSNAKDFLQHTSSDRGEQSPRDS